MRSRLTSTMAVVLALMTVFVYVSTACAAELFEDVDTGQIYTKPGKNRVLLEPEQANAVEAAMKTLYQDPETGAVYSKPGDGRIPIASSARTETAAAAPPPTGDYSSQAFADAVNNIIGERESKTYPKVKLGAEAYVGYAYDFDNEKAGSHNANKFSLNRGYINFNADLSPEVFFRVTPDISRLSSGDYELRIKYLYVGFHNFLAAYPSLQVKMGQLQGAWLDHEEGLWTYRVEGTMMIEREGYMNSANLGLDFQGKLPAGYGAWQALVCNGEGYHADETNKYKSVQARVTLHPLPNNELTKGLELTGFTFFGKKDQQTTRNMYDFLLGYKYKNDLFVGAEYLLTHGSDSYISHPGKTNVNGGGLSVLGWYRMPFYEPIRLMARWDHMDHDMDSPNNTVNRYIYGVSYDIGKYVTILLDGERTVAKAYRGGYAKSYPDENLAKADVLIKF
jgi:hypothetical protein